MVAMDVAVAERSAPLVARLRSRGAEFVGHGLSWEQLVTDTIPETAEQELIKATIARIAAVTGTRVRGWHSAEYSQSSRTVQLLASAGLDYVLDWPNDEQPSPMKVSPGQMTNLPVMLDLDDVLAYTRHSITAPELTLLTRDAFDRLYPMETTTPGFSCSTYIHGSPASPIASSTSRQAYHILWSNPLSGKQPAAKLFTGTGPCPRRDKDARNNRRFLQLTTDLVTLARGRRAPRGPAGCHSRSRAGRVW
jgi:hypothetical protein